MLIAYNDLIVKLSVGKEPLLHREIREGCEHFLRSIPYGLRNVKSEGIGNAGHENFRTLQFLINRTQEWAVKNLNSFSGPTIRVSTSMRCNTLRKRKRVRT